MIYSFFFLSFFFENKGSMLMCVSLGVGCWDSSDAWD